MDYACNSYACKNVVLMCLLGSACSATNVLHYLWSTQLLTMRGFEIYRWINYYGYDKLQARGKYGINQVAQLTHGLKVFWSQGQTHSQAEALLERDRVKHNVIFRQAQPTNEFYPVRTYISRLIRTERECRPVDRPEAIDCSIWLRG